MRLFLIRQSRLIGRVGPVVLLSLALVFGFMGSRGIWDPDEGRYTNVALNMLESGDWLNPKRSDDTGHWTKPPLTYWLVASSLAAFGLNPWAARLPIGLCYLLCVWLVWRIARRIAPETQALAPAIYATMLCPYAASQVVTPDYVLTAAETLAMWAFVEARWRSGRQRGWLALMWGFFGLAFLAKGPPALLPLLAVLLFDLVRPGERRAFQLSGLIIFILLALPWYLATILGNPGLFEYFIRDEVFNRIASDEFGRNGEWYGWIKVYLPTLLVGTLPWTPALCRMASNLVSQAASWREWKIREADAARLFLAIWVLIPLLIFCLSRSRLPLYVLPLFAPLALLLAAQLLHEGRGRLRWPWLAAWVIALLAVKLGVAFLPTHEDASTWAGAIEERAGPLIHEVVFVEDVARYGLRLHLDAGIETISLQPLPPGVQARFNPPVDEDLAMELGESVDDPRVVWICKQSLWPEVQAAVVALGYQALALGTPYRERIVFRTLHVQPEAQGAGE